MTGVSMVTIGPVLGHGVYADQKTLESVLECAGTYEGGLKVKFEHDTGAKDIVGVLKDYRIDADRLRGDLHLLKNSPHFDHLMEMAELMPASFGLSISFSGNYETIELGEADQAVKIQAMRCKEIYSCDVVDNPAANPSGLFKRGDGNRKARRRSKAYQGGTGNGGDVEQRLDHVEEMLQELLDAIDALPDEVGAMIEAMERKIADADLLSLRRLGTMGVPAGGVPIVRKTEPSAPAKTLSEQLEAIPAHNVAARRDFLKKHQAELHLELEAKKAK
ncbi:MAG: hypothetical protein JO081_16350 [Alphaproteobacteria bacterium]|nr:hypothetical protein [Alphaproteobacteria bacterium]